MQSIIRHMNNPFSGFLAFLTGSTVTVTEIVKNGSMWLTFGGALLAVLGGWWTLRTSKVRFQIEMTKLKQAELEFERAAGLLNGEPPIKNPARFQP